MFHTDNYVGIPVASQHLLWEERRAEQHVPARRPLDHQWLRP